MPAGDEIAMAEEAERALMMRGVPAEAAERDVEYVISHKSNAQQDRALGFWFFLLTDLVLFAVLFANYAVLRWGTAGGPTPHDIFELPRLAAQTALLLLSSVSFGMMSYYGTGCKRWPTLVWLVITMVLALGFLALEAQEFSSLAAQGATPQRSGFLSAFFVLVGVHGFHVLVGVVMLTVMGLQIVEKGLNNAVLSRLYRVGLYWHFLDLVWIAIFSFVYLPGIAQ